MRIDWSRVSGFDWDAGNARKNAVKHGVSQSEAEEVFVNAPLIVVFDVAHSVDETRFQALGKTNNGRLMHVTFTLRQAETLIRVISARDMSVKERIVYAQAS